MEVLGGRGFPGLVWDSFFDTFPFFIRYGNINFMGSGAIPNRQGVALAGNRLPGQVRLLLREQNRITAYNELWERVQSADSYNDALQLIGEEVTLIDTAK